MTASLWSGGVTWGPDADAGTWMPDGASPSGRPVPDVAIAGRRVNNDIQSASWSLGPSDILADLSPGSAALEFVGEVDATPDDDLVISTGWGAMWVGNVQSVSVRKDAAGMYWTSVSAVDKVGRMGLAQLRKDNGKVGTLVEVIEYLARRAGVRVRVEDASVGTYGLIQLQRFAYWSKKFTGSMLEYLNIAARSSNAMVALQPDGSLRTMTREALPSLPTSVTLAGDDSPVTLTKRLAWGDDVNRWTFTDPGGVDVEQSIATDILAHGEKAYAVSDWLDAGDSPPYLQLATPFTDWFAYVPELRWVLTDGQFVVSDLDQEDLLTLAPLDWISVDGELWQVMSMQWSIDAPGQPMRLNITGDDLLAHMAGIYPGPVISNVVASSITSDSVTVSWDLDQVGTGYVEYGPTTAYGSESTHETSYDYDSHSQVITGLAPGTLYHFRVRSSAPQGAPLESVSPDFTFTTTSVSLPGGVTALTNVTPPGSADSLPSVGTPVADRMGFDTQRTRISSRADHGNHYPPQQAWSKDGTYIALTNLPNTGLGGYILDGASPYAEVRALTLIGLFWDPADDPIRIATFSNDAFLSYANAATGSSGTLDGKTFDYQEVAMDTHCMGPSWDGRYYPITARVSTGVYEAIVWDRVTDQIWGPISVGVANQGGGDRCTISPSGQYMSIVTENPTSGGQDFHIFGGPEHPTPSQRMAPMPYHWAGGTAAYRWSLGRILPQAPHWDWAKDANGDDCIVTVGSAGRFASNTGPWMIRAADGRTTALLAGANNPFRVTGHISGQARHMNGTNAGGWVFVAEGSTQSGIRTLPGYAQVVAIKLNLGTSEGAVVGSPEYRVYGYSEIGGSGGTWGGDENPPSEQAYPYPSPSPTGDRVLISSGMRASSTPTCYTYVLELTP